MKKLLIILMLLAPGLLIAQDYIKTYEMGDESARDKLNAVILSATTLTTGTLDVDSINNSGDLVVSGSSAFTSTVTIDSTLVVDSLRVTGESSFASPVTIDTTMIVDSLRVTGESSFAGPVAMDSTVVIDSLRITDDLVVSGDIVVAGGLQYIPTAIEYTDTITLTATEIVGTDAGDVGHADGAILVAGPGTGYTLELVSAFLIYDYSTATYTGGADDAVIQIGVTGTQVSVTGAITGASLLEAAADAILRLGSTATELTYADNGAISLHGTALTQPGTAAGELRVHVTYRKHTTGL